jgi:arginyl-tRNA synthetase
MNIENYLKEKIKSAIISELRISAEGLNIILEKPKFAEYGDLSTNVALTLASQLKVKPRDIAQKIVNGLNIDESYISSVEIAGPGFINFKFGNKLLYEILLKILKQENDYGKSDIGKDKKVQVEFVSANPTGPLTVGHGRQAIIGDTIANLFQWTGHNVVREYYYNDAGKQMERLGWSVYVRYLEILGNKINEELQKKLEEGYQGEYLIDVAEKIKMEWSDKLKNPESQGKDISFFKNYAEDYIFNWIKSTLEKVNVKFDSFYSESWLYERGYISEVVQELTQKGLVYEKDGALWLKLNEINPKLSEKVIVKNTGEPTYRLPDIAYHKEKFRAGKYDLVIDIFGADHIATFPDVLAGLKALGYDDNKVKVLIHQFVTLIKDGQPVKMSKRKADFITFEELIEEVGADATRYFFIMRDANSHLNFDLNLAKQQSDENPVYYVQYAYARISSIMDYAKEHNIEVDWKNEIDKLKYDLLIKQEEIDLIKHLINFPKLILTCLENLAPHHITLYLHEIATLFHRFYHDCRVVTEDIDLSKVRLALCRAVQVVLFNGLSILGVSAPSRM